MNPCIGQYYNGRRVVGIYPNQPVEQSLAQGRTPDTIHITYTICGLWAESLTLRRFTENGNVQSYQGLTETP